MWVEELVKEQPGERWMLDLWLANRFLCWKAGSPENIHKVIIALPTY